MAYKLAQLVDYAPCNQSFYVQSWSLSTQQNIHNIGNVVSHWELKLSVALHFRNYLKKRNFGGFGSFTKNLPKFLLGNFDFY